VSTDLETRIFRLERQNRRHGALRGNLAGAGALVAAVRPVEADPPAATESRVSKLELVDSEGRVRARLGLDGEGKASLELLDPEGRPRAVLAAGEEGFPSLALRNAQGKAQLIASVREAKAALLLCDAAGQWGTSLTFRDENGTSLLGMKLPEDEELRAVMTVMKDGRPYVRLRGPDGELRIHAKEEVEFRPAAEK
jgi:hypothetical protein